MIPVLVLLLLWIKTNLPLTARKPHEIARTELPKDPKT